LTVKVSALEIIPETLRLRGPKFVAGAVILYAALRLAGFHKLFADDAEGIAALLQIIGTLYSVVYAFATYVIWGQFAAVENEILKEVGALKDLLVFSRPMKETDRDPIVRAVRAYARAVVESEWGMLSRGDDPDRTDKLFAAIISSVTDLKTDSESELPAYEYRAAQRKLPQLCRSHADARLRARGDGTGEPGREIPYGIYVRRASAFPLPSHAGL
jgi:hypothetical protein